MTNEQAWLQEWAKQWDQENLYNKPIHHFEIDLKDSIPLGDKLN